MATLTAVRSLRTKVLGYLRAGSVTVLNARTAPTGPRRPEYVDALVDGYRSTHRVHLVYGVWSCSCREDGCAHVAAVQMVTGHPTAARPTPTTLTEVSR